MSAKFPIIFNQRYFIEYEHGFIDTPKILGDVCFKLSLAHYSIFSQSKDIRNKQIKDHSWVIGIPATILMFILFKITLPLLILGVIARFISKAQEKNYQIFEQAAVPRAPVFADKEMYTTRRGLTLTSQATLVNHTIKRAQQGADIENKLSGLLLNLHLTQDLLPLLLKFEKNATGFEETEFDCQTTYPNAYFISPHLSKETFLDLLAHFIKQSPHLHPYHEDGAIVYPAVAVRALLLAAKPEQITHFLDDSKILDADEKEMILKTSIHVWLQVEKKTEDQNIQENLASCIHWLAQYGENVSLPIQPSEALGKKMQDIDLPIVENLAFDKQTLHTMILDAYLTVGEPLEKIHPKITQRFEQIFLLFETQAHTVSSHEIVTLLQAVDQQNPVDLAALFEREKNVATAIQALSKESASPERIQWSNEIVAALLLYVISRKKPENLTEQAWGFPRLSALALRLFAFSPTLPEIKKTEKGWKRKKITEHPERAAFAEAIKKAISYLSSEQRAEIARCDWIVSAILPYFANHKQQTQEFTDQFVMFAYPIEWLTTEDESQFKWIASSIKTSDTKKYEAWLDSLHLDLFNLIA